MALTATTNTTANTALRYLSQNNAAASSSLAKLSSGSRIVKASDDAASLAIGTKIKADVTALKQAQVNAGQASSLLQVADGGLSQTTDILMRMKALAVQAQSGSVSDNERGFLDKEFQALSGQIDAIAAQTKFNGTELLSGNIATAFSAIGTAIDGSGAAELKLTGGSEAGAYTVAYDDATGVLTVTQGTGVGAESQSVTLDNTDTAFTGSVAFDQFGLEVAFTAFDLDTVAIAANNTATVTSGAMSFQVGVSSSDTIDVTIADIRTTALGDGTNTLSDDGSGSPASIGTAAKAAGAVDIIDGALSQISEGRADVGALISRFEFAAANVATTIENLDSARSTLLDVDMAAEMSNFSSKQVLVQASVAMLAQANQMPQQLLRLLN
ncbi:MAG: flagellin [Geminicoccaceae bacterium]|jgi:flagellin|nr:flagellin [Geminicoccaceae bacterium]